MQVEQLSGVVSTKQVTKSQLTKKNSQPTRLNDRYSEYFFRIQYVVGSSTYNRVGKGGPLDENFSLSHIE